MSEQSTEIKPARLEPLYDRILVQQHAEVSERRGFAVAETHKERPLAGIVVAAGIGKPLPDGSTRAPIVAVGDEVLFGRHAGIPLDELGLEDIGIAEKGLVTMREDEVIAILRRG